MIEYEKISISDYLKIRHYDEKQLIANELTQRITNGEDISEQEWEDIINQPLRVGDKIPEVGKEFPIFITEKNIVEEGELPQFTLQLKRVMLTE